MKKTKKMIRNFIFFILLIIITFYVILKGQNITELFEIVRTAKKEFILMAVICMCLYLGCEAINIGRTLKALGEKSTFFQNLKYAFIGFFFSSITPAASGGQPMQIYYMYKDKISVANSTLALLINLTCVQIVTISIALMSVGVNSHYMNRALRLFFVMGVGLNLTALSLLFISIFSKRMTRALINIVIKILTFFKVKNIEEKQAKFEAELNKYQESATYIKNNKLVMLKTLLTTYIQYLLFYAISYCVYCSFGLKGHSILKIVTLQSVLYATVSGIPSPGAVGVSEGGFLAIFSKIFPEGMVKGAMLLNRGISFYLFVLISSIVVMINVIREKKDDGTIGDEIAARTKLS